VELTKRQRNDIFEALRTKGVDPADCEMTIRRETPWRDDATRNVLTHFGPTFVGSVEIAHAATSSVFELVLSPTGWNTEYHFRWDVGEGPSLWDSFRALNSWDHVLEQVTGWAAEVQYVNDTPDFWEELKRTPQILASVEQAEIGDTPFVPGEQVEIGRRLDEVKQLVREKFELTDEQLAAIDQRLDDAKEAAKHTDRKTWLYTFYGAVMSTFMTDEIPPHVIQTIVTTVLHGIGHIFGISGPPPVIGP
jgi:hypothetical protein